MGSHVYWLFFFVLLYWGYCITIGVRGYMQAKKGADYFIAGRQLNVWVFVLAATATSFSGWTLSDIRPSSGETAYPMDMHPSMY